VETSKVEEEEDIVKLIMLSAILFLLPGSNEKVVLIAVAGRSNGLGPVLSGNTCFPVINCPPVKSENVAQDIWSSLNVPSGEQCFSVIFYQEVYFHINMPDSIREILSLSFDGDTKCNDWCRC
jgi:hypothetical protein